MNMNNLTDNEIDSRLSLLFEINKLIAKRCLNPHVVEDIVTFIDNAIISTDCDKIETKELNDNI
jgi:hypothetical protein